MVDWLGYFPHLWWHRQEAPPRTGMRHPHFCPYGPFPAGDGRLFGFAVLSAEHWRALCADVVDRLDLLDDPRFATNEARVEHRGLLEPFLEELFGALSAEEWLEMLGAARIPCGAVNEIPTSSSTRSSHTTASSSTSSPRSAARDRQPVPG